MSLRGARNERRGNPDAWLANRAQHGVERAATLEDLFSQSQVLIELAPNTPANHHIVDEAMLRRLPGQAVFVAVEGRIFVGLDVYEKEPLPADSPSANCPISPCSPTSAAPHRRRDAGAEGFRNIKAYLAGQQLSSVVSVDVYDRAT